jgi:hypothetical protein
MRFRCMLHTFYLNIAKVDFVLHMLQRPYTYVVSVCFKCFSCFKRMLQVFCLYIVYVALTIHVCCKCMFQMFYLFQTYVVSVLSVWYMLRWAYTYVASVCLEFHQFGTYVIANVLCCKCCMTWKVGVGEGGPLGRSGPRVRAGSEADTTAPHACVGACAPQQQAGPGRQARQQQRAGG